MYDREIASATNSSGELTSCAVKPTGATVREISGFLDGVMQKVTSLKRRAEESTLEELECTRLCKARLDHLKSYASGVYDVQNLGQARLTCHLSKHLSLVSCASLSLPDLRVNFFFTISYFFYCVLHIL